jgi:hypothetical protein
MPDVEALKKHARVAAQTHASLNSMKVCNKQFPEIEKDECILLNIYRLFDKKHRTMDYVDPAAEWLLDNFYVILDEIRSIKQICNRKYSRSFPVTGASQKDAVPRVYALASNLVEVSDAHLNEHIICIYINEYQKIHALTSREIWAIPVMLKIALVKKINMIASGFTNLQKRKMSEQKLNPTDNHILISSKVLISNAIASLKFLSGTRWEEVFDEISIVDKILSEDPTQVYSDMDFETRNYYREQIERLARITSLDESNIAREVVNCAQNALLSSDKIQREAHVGFYLMITQGQNILKRKLGLNNKWLDMLKSWFKEHPFFSYLSCILLLSAGQFLALAAYLCYFDVIWYSTIAFPSYILVFIPIISISASFTTWIVTKLVSPSIIPKIEIKGDIPSKFRTMVIIPALLTDPKRTVELISQLEVYYLANKHKNLHFAIVGDFKDSTTEECLKDQEITKSASYALDELNSRYCPENNDIFFFFLRRRQWNPTEYVWMGWERKRGAIVEFNRLLKGDSYSDYCIKKGDLSVLKQIKYVITLDCDTKLPGNAAKRLIGAMAHPLNHPELNEYSNRVIQGYGLLQPRIGISIESANRSHFSSTFSGQTGIDPYTSAVSDVYQDMFGEGIYVGKGIYDVDVFYKLLDNALPENSILSHDLLEGCIVRSGLITDVELIDSYPSSYMAYAMRLHRWTRGDWQLIPWLSAVIPDSDGNFNKNPLTHICKWKILDNLRRSLVNPSLLLLLFGSAVLPPNPIPWLFIFGSMLFFPLIIKIYDAFLKAFTESRIKNVIVDFVFDSRKLINQSLLNFAFLPFQSWLMIDAISKVLVRIIYTRKGLLEWTTAEDTEKAFKGTLMDYHRKMWSSVLIGIVFLLWILLFYENLLIYTMLISLIWILAPTIAFYISKPQIICFHTFSEEQTFKLRQLARNTWNYFDELVGNEVHWLPPDNFQIDPPKGLAYRTSPTNIGLWLMSVVSARDLGFIGTIDAVERLEYALATLEKLNRWNGHLYNWYSLTTLNPVEPMIISSVDSGNLAVYLVALSESIKDMLQTPLICKEMLMHIRELTILHIEKYEQKKFSLDALLTTERITLSEWRILLSELKEINKESEQYAISFENEMNCFFSWVFELDKLPVLTEELKRYCPQTYDKLNRLLEKLQVPLAVTDILDECDNVQYGLSDCLKSISDEKCDDIDVSELKKWIEKVKSAISQSKAFTEKFVSKCRILIMKFENIFNQMDFKPLYDKKLDLFSVGYDTDKKQLFESYYDLLASEARQTSFIAIAKGDVPYKHWFKLGRRLTKIGNLKALLSWSGTMFEYLMPNIVMKTYDETLLSETCIAAVKAQIHHCKLLNVPWGISESAFYAFNSQSLYQYKAFGIPDLGYKRGLNEDTVITPYASALALQIEPLASFKNIEALITKGLNGIYGLYEAIDYTLQRVECEREGKIVKTYMAHHQGMILVALNNCLNNNIMQKRFHSHPMVRATELLLQERIPKNEVSKTTHNEHMSDMGADKKNQSNTR